MQDIGLLATDFDGTVVGSANDLLLYDSFRERLEEFRRDRKTIWVICTGRSLREFSDHLAPMRQMGIVPEYVIVHHAYIYSLTRFGYLPHILWNLRIRYLQWLSLLNTHDAIEKWYEAVVRVSKGVTVVRKEDHRLWLRFDSKETAASMATMLRKEVKPYHHLRVFEYLMEVDVRLVPFTKGLAVAELARHLHIDSDNILAIGNGHNDISMLEGKIAKLTGCPANSEPEVMEVVHRAGGHIANRNSLGGLMEVLDAYRTNSVNSELPAHWKDPASGANSRGQRANRHKGTGRPSINPWAIGVTAYIVLLTFAIYVPFPFAGWIAKPYWVLMGWIEKLVSCFTG